MNGVLSYSRPRTPHDLNLRRSSAIVMSSRQELLITTSAPVEEMMRLSAEMHPGLAVDVPPLR